MRTLIIDSPASREHAVPPGHPEHVGRYRAIIGALDADAPDLRRLNAPKAMRGDLLRVHAAQHVDRIFSFDPGPQGAALDPDTWMAPGSLGAALHAAGAGIAAVDAVLEADEGAAFCVVRPPGHHAEPDRPMGFCLFNNIAVAALYALEEKALSHVAVVDIDVHHGNGTQTVAEREPRLFFASIHESPLYPGTGHAHETGLNGNVVNMPVRSGTTGLQWRARLEADLFPALARFAPQMLFVSAGFDAHADDPLAGLALTESDYAWAAARLVEIARQCGHPRLVCMLEGGYDLPALGRSAAAFVRALADA
ncbi:MAG: histone deacetylase family protein [Maricaulaceae bacterium]|nr:histone deacetylase family protein [Maricaulaceae bacterium]